MSDPSRDQRIAVVRALLDGLGYEDAAVAGQFPVAEARAIFRDLRRSGVLASIHRQARQRRAGGDAS